MLKAPRLKKGDVVGLCSPSGTIAHKRDLFERAKKNFEQVTGLQTLVSPCALHCHYYSAGKPEDRLADFHYLLKHPDVKAIIFAAGGDTAIDLVENIDYDLIKKQPKIIAGISDATTLLSPITAKTGLITFLGVELLDFAKHSMQYEVDSMIESWFEGKIPTVTSNPAWHDLDHTYTTFNGAWQTIRPGKASGQLVGGNFQSFMQLVGTEYELKFPESILFLETYKLPKKQIHKGLMQLKIHGVLDRINGLIMGYCLESDNPDVVGNEQPLRETALEATADYDFPIMQIGEIGHRVENWVQPFGAHASMDATALHIEILENVTA